MQIAAIEGADIPDVFKALLLNNNNEETYSDLGAESFAQYVAAYATKLVLNILAFILTFVVVTVVLRAIIFALDIVANLPVIGFFNRLGGAVLGAVGAPCHRVDPLHAHHHAVHHILWKGGVRRDPGERDPAHNL